MWGSGVEMGRWAVRSCSRAEEIAQARHPRYRSSGSLECAAVSEMTYGLPETPAIAPPACRWVCPRPCRRREGVSSEERETIACRW
jgi:hypothetical protein